MSAPLTLGLSIELLLRVINIKYGYFTFLYFTQNTSFPRELINARKIFKTVENQGSTLVVVRSGHVKTPKNICWKS